jgi:hypothetical protein
LKNYFPARLAQQWFVQPAPQATKIHAPDDTNCNIARLSPRLEFFNSLSQNRKCERLMAPTDFIFALFLTDTLGGQELRSTWTDLGHCVSSNAMRFM